MEHLVEELIYCKVLSFSLLFVSSKRFILSMAWIVLMITSSRIMGENILCMLEEGFKSGWNEFEPKSYDITTVCYT